jgi:4-amino-4-deoxy-L-arabinose transferase-like glycosyltransferase
MSLLKRVSGERWMTLALAAAAFVVFGTVALARYRPLTYLMGDGPYYAETAVSLLHDHDLDLRNQLSGGLQVHGPQIALGPHGEWFPKHPILLAVLGLPFLALFGVPGLLLLNLIVLATLAAAMFRLARHFAPASAAALAAGVLVVGTFLRAYAYNLSPDLLAALLATLAALALLEGRMPAAGLLLGTMVMSKPILVVFLPPAVAYALARGRLRAAARLAGGGLLPLGALLLLNLALFGSPFVTSYDRNVVFVDGAATLLSHRSLFDNNPIAGARAQILDTQHGLLATAPVLLLALPGTLLLLRRRTAETLWLTGSAAALFAVLCVYRPWYTSHYGNRFLMPAVAFATPAVAAALEAALDLVRTRAGARRLPRALADGA